MNILWEYVHILNHNLYLENKKLNADQVLPGVDSESTTQKTE